MRDDLISSVVEAGREWRLARVATDEARERLIDACVAAAEGGVSHSELARALGVKRPSLVRWLRERRIDRSA